MDGIGDGPNGMGYDMPSMLMNQQPAAFGAYGHEGSPITASLPNPTFQDESLMGLGDDSNDPKRRRIARVSDGILLDGFPGLSDCCICRLVICAGKRKSNATGRCQNAPTALTTRPIACSLRSRRNATRPKGTVFRFALQRLSADCSFCLVPNILRASRTG